MAEIYTSQAIFCNYASVYTKEFSTCFEAEYIYKEFKWKSFDKKYIYSRSMQICWVNYFYVESLSAFTVKNLRMFKFES